MLQAGLEWLSSMRHTHMTETVQYVRAASTPVSASLSATPIRVARDAATEINVAINSEFMDWRFRSADLVDAGVSQPRPGDEVVQAVGVQDVIWQVIERDNLPCFAYADSTQVDVTVRTRRVPDSAVLP